MKISVLEGHKIPREKPHKHKRARRPRSPRQRERDQAMKACAIDHRVATRSFWSCVRESEPSRGR